MSGYDNPKVDRLLDACVDFTERDFADLAVAASDQAMLDVQGQAALRVLLDTKRGRACEARLGAADALAAALHDLAAARARIDELTLLARSKQQVIDQLERKLDTAIARIDALEYAATEAGEAFATQLVARFGDTAALRSAVLETIRTEHATLGIVSTDEQRQHEAGNLAMAIIAYAEGETVVVNVDGKAA